MPYKVIHWQWEEAFNKFGFGDGDGLVMTHDVAEALLKEGYNVQYDSWGCHNTLILSIKDKKGKELIPENINVGYDDPRSYLPKKIIKILDEKFPDEGLE